MGGERAGRNGEAAGDVAGRHAVRPGLDEQAEDGEAAFLGKGPDPKDTTLIARWAFRAFGGSGEGDMRDWDKIGAWAGEIHVDKEAAR